MKPADLPERYVIPGNGVAREYVNQPHEGLTYVKDHLLGAGRIADHNARMRSTFDGHMNGRTKPLGKIRTMLRYPEGMLPWVQRNFPHIFTGTPEEQVRAVELFAKMFPQWVVVGQARPARVGPGGSIKVD